MTHYNFDRIISRTNTNCSKWDNIEPVFGEKDVLPMWIADMDFPVAGPITEALRNRLDHEIYGYSLIRPDSTLRAIVDRLKEKYHWAIKPEWIVLGSGTISAMYDMVTTFAAPGDAIIVQEPIFYPFLSLIEKGGCRVANNQLKLVDGRYEIDFDDLDKRFQPVVRMVPADARVRAMILCHPHNPTGRVWTRDELIRMGEIVIGNGAIMISDEIHCELLFKGRQHIPFAAISEEFAQKSIVCMGPTKTFNLAGLEVSFAVIPNDDLRKRFVGMKTGISPFGNVFGRIALEAAFRDGDEWLAQLLDYLQGNLDFMTAYIEENIPGIRVIKPGGTYLIWLDCREIGLNSEDLADFFNKKAKVGLAHGMAFGSGGDGFERINIACPRSILKKVLQRIEHAVHELKKGDQLHDRF